MNDEKRDDDLLTCPECRSTFAVEDDAPDWLDDRLAAARAEGRAEQLTDDDRFGLAAVYGYELGLQEGRAEGADAENGVPAQGMRCDAQYGRNPDRCYLQFNHRGPHSNQYGTTWARVNPPDKGRNAAGAGA